VIKIKLNLWDIREACKDILNFIDGVSFHDFSNNKMVRYAVERQILVIGEAANHLSEEFINDSKDIPWRKIIGMRNNIAQEYGEVLVERIWITANDHIEELLKNIDRFLDD